MRQTVPEAAPHSGPPDLRSKIHRSVWTLTSSLTAVTALVGLASVNQVAGALAAFAVALCTASTASASEKSRIKSRFTTVELKSCEAAKADSEGRSWTCKGLAGYPVYVAEGDLRQFISFGANGKSRRAATQTLQSLSSIFSAQHGRATIEWRFRRSDGRDVPYATIMRFYTSHGSTKAKGDSGTTGAKGEVLIVTKVTPADACQIVRIDARANPDAIMLARSAADELSAEFDCKTDQPRVVGAIGRSPM
jgi:hypothetical protein